MKELLCDTTHLYVIIGVLLIVMICLGSGKGIGILIKPLIQKLTGKSPVTVNVGCDDSKEGLSEGCIERRKYPPITLADLKDVLATMHIRPPDYDLVKTRQEGVLKDISFVVQDCKALWLEIKEINLRQFQLREKLPEQYVNKSDLVGINDRLKSIDDKLSRYIEHYIK